MQSIFVVLISCAGLASCDVGSTQGQGAHPSKEPCQCMPVYMCGNDTDYYGENVIDIRFGVSGCSHYMEKCCAAPSGPVPPRTPETPTPSLRCGVRNSHGVGFRITGDTDYEANYGEFPWMVALLQGPKMICGGSLIHPAAVLTAAHCVKGKKNITVRAGEWDTKTDKEEYPIQERSVRTVIIHEKYYSAGLHNDIALLLLETPLTLTPVVDTICLPSTLADVNGNSCAVSGWGKNAFGDNVKHQAILKKVELPLVTRAECQEKLRTTVLGPEFTLHESLLCAGGQFGRDACKGDGGGPLVCPSKTDPTRYQQVGMVAWGLGCGEAIPAGYVNIPYLRLWIDDKMTSLALNKTPYLQ